MYSFIVALVEKFTEKNQTWWQSGYAIAILAVAIVTILKLLLNPIVEVESPFLLYFAAVMFSSLYGGWQAGILATILSALLSDYLFLSPNHLVLTGSFGQMLRLGIFISEGLLISLIVSALQSTTQQLRLSQQTLGESEERYRLLVDMVQDYAIYMFDPDGYLISWNLGASKLNGYRSDEIIGQHFSRFYAQEDVEQGLLESVLQKAATTGRVETEGWHIRKDGSRFWANVIITALRDEAGNLKGFSNVTRDVTAIKEYEAERDRLIRELQLERSRLETILEQMPVGVVMAESATGKLIFGNQEMEKIFRHSFIPAENIQQYQKYKTFLPDGRPYQPQETVLARTITRGEVVKDEEIYILRGDGTCGTILANSTPLYNEQGQIEAGLVAFLDISERKQVQKQLANLNSILEERVQERTAQLEQARNEAQLTLNLLNGIIEGTNDLIAAVDLEFRFTAFNSAYKQEFTKVFGREPELGISILDAVAHLPIEQAKFRETWGRALQEDNYTIIQDFETINSERYYYEINFSSIKDANNQLIGTSQIVRNVTDRILTEEQIHNLNQELEQKVIERTQALEAEIQERIKIEANLRESEEKFRATFAQIAVGIAQATLEGKYLLVNQKLCDILGYSQTEIMNLSITDITYAEDIETDLENIQRIVANEIKSFSMEKRYIRKDGSLVWGNLTVSVVREANGEPKYLLGVLEDISDRKRFEENLAAKNREITNILNSITDGFVSLDKDWRYTYVNSKAEEILGKQKSDLLGNNIWEVFPEAVGLPGYRYCYQAVKEQITIKYEEFNPFLNKWLDVRLYPSADALTLYFQDITDRQQAENALRESEQSFRNLADSMPQIVWTANPDGTVDYYNQRVYEFTGFSQQADGTWQWQPVLHSDDEQRTVEVWQQAVETGEIYECEHRVKKVNGEFCWHLSRGIPVKDEQGCVIKWYGTATDIHAQKQYQAEREELLRREQTARTEAESASRLKDEFLATLSHELRTPMNAMLGWTTMLRTRKLNETTTARALETIERNTKTLNQLIEDILDVSRIIRGKVRFSLQPLELLPVVEQAIETIKPTATVKDIQVVLEPLQANSVKVMGDSSRLQQIIWNLLSNAIKFTPNGGCVTIRLSEVIAKEGEVAETEKFSPFPILNSHFAQIQITDTGIGIASEFLPFVFDRFRQADGSITRSHGGLGLGLAIVRHLVELHGGTIEVSSLGVGQGATFTVNLPLVVDSSSVPEQAGRGEGSISSMSDYLLLKDLRVLVVDDEPDARDLITVILEDRGAKVTAVGSAQEAFTRVLQKSLLDIIVSDIGMPEGDGYSLIRQIRKLPPEAGGKIPAIALTAYASSEDCNTAISAGFNLHIPKPVDPTELTMAIAQIVKRF